MAVSLLRLAGSSRVTIDGDVFAEAGKSSSVTVNGGVTAEAGSES